MFNRPELQAAQESMAYQRDEPVSNASDHSAQLREKKACQIDIAVLIDATLVTSGKSPLSYRADRAHHSSHQSPH